MSFPISAEEIKRCNKDIIFWTEYCRKTRNWGVGPLATYINEPGWIQQHERESVLLWRKHRTSPSPSTDLP